jgi:Zn-dependent metalloprotease
MDSLGYTLYRCKQYYNGYAVEHTDFYLHYKDSLLVEANANVVPNLNIPTNATISEAIALENALNYLNAREYAWQNADMMAQLRQDTEDTTATYYPAGKLVIINNNSIAKLAYRFTIVSTKPFKYDYVYIDATRGEVITTHSLLKIPNENETDASFPRTENDKGFTNKCDVDGTCITLYNGQQDITLIKRPFDYKLDECERRIHTFWDEDVLLGVYKEITNGNKNWGTKAQAATSAHWASEKAHDYFRNVFGRRGSDGNRRWLRVLVGGNSSTTSGIANFPNMLSGGIDVIFVGKEVGYSTPSLNTNKSHATLDMVGAAYTDLVVANTMSAVGHESDALWHSFRAIFGTMVERYGQNGNFDWTIGEDKGKIMYNISQPWLLQHPSIYKGVNWKVDYDNVSYGIINSGVQNYWFYLLSMGGSQNGVTVQGIGIDKAALIAYLNMTTKLQQNADYAHAREGSIQVAIQLFGSCSNEVTQVRKAWEAVKVGQATGGCITIQGQPAHCLPFANNISYSVYSTFNNPITWTVFPAIPYTLSGINNSTITFNNIPDGITNIVITASVSSSINWSEGRIFTASYLIRGRNCTIRPCIGCPKDQWGLERAFNTNITENTNTTVFLYPNPTSGIVTLDLGIEKVETTYARLLNAQGAEVGDFVLKNRVSVLDVSQLSAGMYFLHIMVRNERKVLKIVIK